MLQNQKGYITLALVIFALFTAFFIMPRNFPKPDDKEVQVESSACAPDNDPSSPTVTTRGYTFTDETTSDSFTLQGETTFKRVKKNIPMSEDSIERPGNTDIHWTKGGDVVASDNKRYRIYYPSKIAQDCGGQNNVGSDGKCLPGKLLHEGNISYSFTGAEGQSAWVHFYKHGMIILVHLNDDGSIEKVDGFANQDARTFWISDIYVDPGKEPLPEDVLKCQDVLPPPGVTGIRLNTNKYASDNADSGSNNFNTVVVPQQIKSADGKQLQLEWFLFEKSDEIFSRWWTPHCKPAIYLYPEDKSLVNVKVKPQGVLTYVDPPYDAENGWTVEAYPTGKIMTESKEYSYLYFESKIKDELIKKPTQGWVVKFDELESLYQDILPKMGLNRAQTKDFTEYWRKSLPNSPYYFVGVLSQENINSFEPLTITPKPDSVNRVRVYFEALDNYKEVEVPILSSPSMSGFKVVEWGGMVKRDKDHPFTCSQ